MESDSRQTWAARFCPVPYNVDVHVALPQPACRYIDQIVTQLTSAPLFCLHFTLEPELGRIYNHVYVPWWPHDFTPDINSWNTAEAAEAELRSEIQALAAGMASPRGGHPSPNRGVGEFSIMATHHCHSLPVTPSPIRMVGPRMLRDRLLLDNEYRHP